MLNSIPTEAWQINADDPLALTFLLGLPEFRVTRLEYHDHLEMLLVFCSPVDQVAACPSCGTLSFQLHESKQRLVRDLAVAGKPSYLVIEARRFKCQQCRKPFTEALRSIARLARYTRRYEQYLFEQCRGSTIQAICRQERLGYKAVEGVYFRLAARVQASAPPPLVRRLGIDEIALKKGHGQYALVLTDLERGCVLTVLADRTKETLEAYLATWSAEQRAAITDVALDLWEPYHLAVRASLPNAQICGDRFHVMKNLTERVAQARREIQRQAAKEVKAQLKGSRWLLLKNAEDLTEEEQTKLEAMYAVSPTLKRLQELKEAFRTIFETEREPESASQRLDEWIGEVEQSELSCLRKFVTTLRNWWQVIVRYFAERLTSGFVEGMNNKIKLIKRRGFGYGNFEHFRLRVLIECDGGCDAH
jgi:transposase